MAKRKILIVEDDLDIVEMVEYNLREEGYLTVSALNGEDGVNLARREQPDLIILDIMLPVMDGFEMCRALKSDDTTSHIPVIILSAKSHETDKVVGLELGADDYVTKPFSPRELIAKSSLSVNEAVCLALMARHFKRIVAHLTNIATSVILPLSDLDYYDERRANG
jgi:two-component system alkaline phosphatase synthesis response regulator PhoP